MPRQRVGDIEIYYEVHGAGPRTLVMVRGLGSNLLSWYEQIDVLPRHYKCVMFDNRGAGRTDKPDAPYSIKQMADDTAGLMDALGIGRAALLGISMGGMIAQEFALYHQEKLSCLILGCTHFGGANVVQSPPEIAAAIMAGTNATPSNRSSSYRRCSATTLSIAIPTWLKRTIASARST
jgi:pimeloyl-ACP methyl ester carboxylesterase